MKNNPILNPELFSPETIGDLSKQFHNSLPFKHLVIDNFLHPDFADSIRMGFPNIDDMKTHYSGINEKKAEDNDFSKLDDNFTILHQHLATPAFKQWLTAVTAIGPLHTASDRLGHGLHQGGDRSFLDIHVDYNIHPITKLQRRINLLIFFNPVWEINWGGYLDLWDAKTKKTGQSIAPLHNRAVIFECSEISYHGYSRIKVTQKITRKSFYQYYFTTAAKDVHYHDTIFRPVPGAKLSKKIIVPIKEMAKNGIKKTLLSLGLQRFLK